MDSKGEHERDGNGRDVRRKRGGVEERREKRKGGGRRKHAEGKKRGREEGKKGGRGKREGEKERAKVIAAAVATVFAVDVVIARGRLQCGRPGRGHRGRRGRCHVRGRLLFCRPGDAPFPNISSRTEEDSGRKKVGNDIGGRSPFIN